MMARGGAEIPEDRLVVLGKEGEAVRLVLGPGADVSGREVAHIVHVKAEQGAHLGLGEQFFHALEALAAEAVEVDSLFPVNGHRSVGWQCHKYLAASFEPRATSNRTRVQSRSSQRTWKSDFNP